MKNTNKLFLFLALMLVSVLLFSLIDGSFDKSLEAIGLIFLSIGVGFTTTLGGLLAIDAFKGQLLFNEDKLINEAVRLVKKRLKTNGNFTIDSSDSKTIYVITSQPVTEDSNDESV